jgi:hypothetical protein
MPFPPPTPAEAQAFARAYARRYRTMLALFGAAAVLMWFATLGRPARRHGEPWRSLAYVGTLLVLAAGPLFVWRCPRCRRRLGRRLDVARCPHCDLELVGRRAAPLRGAAAGKANGASGWARGHGVPPSASLRALGPSPRS